MQIAGDIPESNTLKKRPIPAATPREQRRADMPERHTRAVGSVGRTQVSPYDRTLGEIDAGCGARMDNGPTAISVGNGRDSTIGEQVYNRRTEWRTAPQTTLNRRFYTIRAQ